MVRDDSQPREQLANEEVHIARLHVAIAKTIDDLCIISDTFRLGAQNSDEAYVASVKARYMHAATKVAKDLAAALANEKGEEQVLARAASA
jgi:hypothetical protein